MKWKLFGQTRRNIAGLRDTHDRHGALRHVLKGVWEGIARLIRSPGSILDHEVPAQAAQMPPAAEMRARYANASRTATVQAVMAGGMAVASMVAGSALAFLCAMACLIAFSALYLSTSFRLWATRRMWERREDPSAPRSYRFGDYLDEAAKAPSEFLPRRLPT